MRYRRLGRTEAIVSEIGITARAWQDLPLEQATEAAAATFAAGVSLVAIDVRDVQPDLEQLVGEVAGIDRPRLTIVSVFASLPAPELLGPAVEAAAVRLGPAGYLDVVAFPTPLTDAHLAALEEVRARGAIRHAGIATSDPQRAVEAIEAGWAEVLVAPLNLPSRLAMRPAIEAATQHDVGVVLAGRVGNGRTLDLALVAEALTTVEGGADRAGRALVAWGLSESGVHCVAAGVRSPEEARLLVSASRAAPLDEAHVRALEAAARDVG